jgi:hypothetical protein
MLREYHAQAAQSPGETLNGFKVITGCKIDNIPNNIAVEQVTLNLSAAFAEGYPRANPFVWNAVPSDLGHDRLRLSLSFKNSVDDLVVRRMIARELIFELQRTGHDYRKVKLSYGCSQAMPPSGNRPSTRP